MPLEEVGSVDVAVPLVSLGQVFKSASTRTSWFEDWRPLTTQSRYMSRLRLSTWMVERARRHVPTC